MVTRRFTVRDGRAGLASAVPVAPPAAGAPPARHRAAPEGPPKQQPHQEDVPISTASR